MLYHFHLAIGARRWGYDIAPRGTALSELGAHMCLTGKRSFVKAGGILNILVVDRVVDQSLAIS